MTEQTIITKRGVYGRVQIILPQTVKTSLLEQVKLTGMGKAEFLQKALILGASQLAKEQNNHEGGALAQQPART